MSHSHRKCHPRPRRRPQPLSMPNQFVFTERELWRIQRSMLILARAMTDERHRRVPRILAHNVEVARRAIRTVRTGVPTRYVPASKLKRVYEAAHAGFICSRKLGRDEATARKSALISAETELEFAMGILEHVTAEDLVDMDHGHDDHEDPRA